MTRWIRLGLLALGVLILAAFVRSLDVKAISGALAHADLNRLAVAVALLAGNAAVKALRWQIMAGYLSGRPLKFPAAATAIVAGVAAASLTPAKGVEFAKPLLLRASHGVPMTSTTAAVVIERVLDGAALAALFAAALLTVPASRGSAFYPVVAALAVFLTAASVIVLLPHRLAALAGWAAHRAPVPQHVRARAVSVASRFADGLAMWRATRRLGLLLILSVAAAILEVLRLATVLSAFQLRAGVSGVMLAFSAASLAAALTFVPGGIGVTEVSLAGVLRSVAAVGPQAVVGAAVLVDRVLSYYLVVAIGGVILLLAARAQPEAAAGQGDGR